MRETLVLWTRNERSKCLCVCERETASACERERVCERMKTLVLLRRNERSMCVCARERESVCV